MQLDTKIDNGALEELEKKYDTALNTRDNGPSFRRFVYLATLLFALYHF